MHPPVGSNEKKHKEQLRDNIAALSKHLQGEIDISLKVTEKTALLAKLSPADDEKYGYVSTFSNKQKYANLTFWSIGMADPFPDETTTADPNCNMLGDQEFTPENLIYPEYKYSKEMSPLCVYIPSKQLLLKILRACMGVEEVKELWFNRVNE
jgi:hypothetical protein